MNIKVRKSLVLFLSIMATSMIAFGLGYGNSNHNTYLIHGLTLIDPNFLSGDWFARSTQHYHDQFSRVLLFVNYLSLPTNISLVVIEIILRMLALAAIYKIICLITNKYSLISFMAVLFLVVLEKTRSVAGSYIFSSILQPSSFGSAFTLIGFLFFLRKSYFISGICIAFAGYMHTNYLILGFVYLGIAQLFLGTNGLVKRVFLQFSPMIIVLGMKLPFLLGLMLSEDGERATYIFQFIRSPHHYVPSHFIVDFILITGWSFFGLAGLQMLNIKKDIKNNLMGLYGSLLIVLVISTLLTTVVFIPVVSKLFFWRMAPFSVLLSQILFVTAIFKKSFSDKEGSLTPDTMSLLLLLLGCLLIFMWYFIRYDLISVKTLSISGFILSFGMLFFRSLSVEKNHSAIFGENVVKVISIGLLSITLIFTYKTSFYHRSSLLNDFPGKTEIDLYQWVKSTKESTSFLIPPNLQNFRLHAERAIIADWKSTPIDPKGLIEWYNRIQDITGLNILKSSEEVDIAYLSINKERLVYLKNKYAVNYAVLYMENNKLGHEFPVVFKNEEFIIIALD